MDHLNYLQNDLVLDKTSIGFHKSVVYTKHTKKTVILKKSCHVLCKSNAVIYYLRWVNTQAFDTLHYVVIY